MRISFKLLTLVIGLIPALTFAQSGEELFMHQWQANDSLSPQGDGLGPVFNGTSCFQCHHQGGRGGGGTIDQNLDFLSNTNDKTQARLRLIKAHSGFSSRDGLTKDNIILHRYSLDDDYSRIRSNIIEFDGAMCINDRERQRLQRAVSVNPVQEVTLGRGVTVLRSQRNSTALYGAGIIDDLTAASLLALATTHNPKSANVTGRVSVLGFDAPGESVRVGRFGWRGQTSTLADFVTDACAFELGLELEGREQTPDPRDSKYRPPGVDLTEQQVDSLREFVAGLPAPKQIIPADKAARKRVIHGNRVFHHIGCSDCHIQSPVGIQDAYSDFLLHDMGRSLADPVPASPAVAPAVIASAIGRFRPNTQEAAIVGGSSGGSYGGRSSGGGRHLKGFASNVKSTEVNQEWRTAPLWGVADSGPYMHDGRSATLVEAIDAHGGEATDSVEAYLTSRVQDQLALIEFLKTLRAPQTGQD